MMALTVPDLSDNLVTLLRDGPSSPERQQLTGSPERVIHRAVIVDDAATEDQREGEGGITRVGYTEVSAHDDCAPR